MARSLVPAGSTEVSELQAGGAYQLNVTSTMTLDQLKAFWAQAIPASGATSSGQLETDGALTIAFSNPPGGIVASPNADGGFIIVLSFGAT